MLSWTGAEIAFQSLIQSVEVTKIKDVTKDFICFKNISSINSRISLNREYIYILESGSCVQAFYVILE